MGVGVGVGLIVWLDPEIYTGLEVVSIVTFPPTEGTVSIFPSIETILA